MKAVALLSATESVWIPMVALVLSLAVFGVVMAFLGHDPWSVFYSMYRGGFGSAFSWQNTLERASPLLLTALCTALPARLGLIMIGGEGAFVVGGIAAAITGLSLSGWSSHWVIAAMAVLAMVSGGVWIAITGWLKHARGVNETITSLLFNYIAIAVLNHLVTGPLRDPQSLNKPSTMPIGSANMLGDIPGSHIHWGLVFGLALCVIYYVIYQFSTMGFAVRVIGGNLRAAKLVGLPVGRLTILTCFLAGAAAGLAGAIEIAAIHGAANASLVAGYGYAGILVAFLARQNPLTIIPVAIFLGGILASSGLLQRSHHLPDATVFILQGIIFTFILFSETWYGRLKAS